MILAMIREQRVVSLPHASHNLSRNGVLGVGCLTNMLVHYIQVFAIVFKDKCCLIHICKPFHPSWR